MGSYWKEGAKLYYTCRFFFIINLVVVIACFQTVMFIVIVPVVKDTFNFLVIWKFSSSKGFNLQSFKGFSRKKQQQQQKIKTKWKR